MFPARARIHTHPNKPGRVVPDATRLLRGRNILRTTTVDTEYLNILDKVVEEAINKGEITRAQSKGGLWAAYETNNRFLFLCLCATDGSGLVIGTSVPQDRWRMRS